MKFSSLRKLRILMGRGEFYNVDANVLICETSTNTQKRVYVMLCSVKQQTINDSFLHKLPNGVICQNKRAD
jgi:hypothetical protein